MAPWEEYERAIQDAAAAGCMDRDEDGNCAPPERTHLRSGAEPTQHRGGRPGREERAHGRVLGFDTRARVHELYQPGRARGLPLPRPARLLPGGFHAARRERDRERGRSPSGSRDRDRTVGTVGAVLGGQKEGPGENDPDHGAPECQPSPARLHPVASPVLDPSAGFGKKFPGGGVDQESRSASGGGRRERVTRVGSWRQPTPEPGGMTHRQGQCLKVPDLVRARHAGADLSGYPFS